ncbi:MAG TPA: hypothetical protein VFJ69_14545 [Actinomycetota bacterium]|nr:hypothetical protein [Actinomycetota bacterium]
MRRIMIVALSAALLTTTAWVVHGAAAESPTAAATAPAAANTGPPTDNRTLDHGLRMAKLAPLADQLARARLATARYATNLRAAKADGYQILTRMIPDMGWHFLNPTIQGFDITKPPILVYERHGHRWQLGALEWAFPQTPASPPLPGATYGSFGAACHYTDGTFVFARAQELCATRSPRTGARFNFWHPDLVTLHVWLWYPNPAGLYSGTNPYVRPFNHG